MSADLATVLDALDLAIGRAEGVLDDEQLAAAAQAAKAARARRGFLGGTLVLAIAGGTGSGKSSLLNALAGEQVAEVSRIRPHTDRPLAWYPHDAEPGLARLFDRHGIDQRVGHDRFPGLALIDLPDHDSIVSAHRATVDAVLPDVDGVLWVLDPQKYRDRALHRERLAPLADYADQFVFVLNQIDRVTGEVGEVAADAAAALAASGMGTPGIFTIAADPTTGPPLGVDELAGFLRERLDAKRVALGKLLADVRRTADSVAAGAAVTGGGSVDFDRRWAAVLHDAAAGLVAGGVAAQPDAVCRIADFVATLSVEAGGDVGRQLRAAVPQQRIEEAVGAAVAAVPVPAPPRRRWRRRAPEAGGTPAPEAVAFEIDARLRPLLSAELFPRALLGASLASFGVELTTAEARLLPDRGTPPPAR